MDTEESFFRTEEKKSADFIFDYRRMVPGNMFNLLPITINEWRNTVEQLGQGSDVSDYLKQKFISGVSLKICLYWLIKEKRFVFSINI